jgi:hypothetical protein
VTDIHLTRRTPAGQLRYLAEQIARTNGLDQDDRVRLAAVRLQLEQMADELDGVAAPATQAREPETEGQLHARFACPGWEYRTTEGQRKQWDDADRPPSDENGDPDPSWERNVDAGRDGWERFDYTEESYWRRRVAGAATQASEPRSET